MSSDVKYSNIFPGRPVQNIPHELGFRTFHASDCGLQSCLRNVIHFHCRSCGYGTSQISNLVPHRRMCTVAPDLQQKELSRLTPVSESSLAQHDVIPTPQSYPYYSAVTSSGPSSSGQGSKIITTQQSAMFNFVLPTQTSQYSGLYGTQTVFPNPSLFSPSSFNGFGQLDATWLSQPRLMPPSVHSSNPQAPDILGNARNHFEKLEASISPSCCGRIPPMENAAIGLCSPLTAEAYKVVSKEFQSKMDPQNWYCSSQSMMGFGVQNGQPAACKYSESAPSCSISLLLLEQNDLKQSEECINVDDLCFESPKNETKPEAKDSPIEEFSSCMQAGKKDCFRLADVRPSEMDLTEAAQLHENVDLESMTSSDESDIIVEESESDNTDSSEVSVLEVKGSAARCAVCNRQSPLHPLDTFIPLTEDSPATTTTHVSVLAKLAQVIEDFAKTNNSSICQRCLNLINVVDCLEIKLVSAKQQLSDAYKPIKGTEPVPCTAVEKPEEIPQDPAETQPANKLLCEICNKQFSSVRYLEKHKQHHTKSFSFYCEYCGRGFTLLRKLENHILLHSNTSRFQCELCGKRFIQKHALTDHIRRHKGEYRYHCSVCEKGFVKKSVFKIHLESHSTEPAHICQYCGKQFKTTGNFTVHVKICSGDLKFQCEKCEKRFPIESLLKKHVMVKHEAKFSFACGVCQKGFGKESDLKSHLRSHSDDKPFVCSECSKSYKSVSSLRQHMKVHSASHVLTCKVCGKDFSRSNALADHMHQHDGTKPYKCHICWKTFANRINFKTHTKRHEGTLKQTPCPVCGKLFVKGLKDHMASHTDHKSSCCKQCGALFSVKSSLNKHIKTKHGNLLIDNKT